MSSFRPTVGYVYNAVCPVCFSTLEFKCESLYKSRVICSQCNSVVDLRTLTAVDLAQEGPEVALSDPVLYASGVEVNVSCAPGGTAVDQVAALMKETEEGLQIPSKISVETTHAVKEERAVALTQKLWPLFFVTYTLEFFLFGRAKPYCKIGHVRVYRKKIPFLGYRFIPAPRTTTSYSTLSVIIGFFFICACFSVGRCEQAYIQSLIPLLFVLMIILYVDMYLVAYSDPGYILPGYISGDENAGSQILDRDTIFNHKNDQTIVMSIENDKKESKWKTINGTPMERKWCSQCRFYRPVRAAHCYQCGLCVSVHDHHCVVTGGCVGRRNILFFTWFVTEGCCAAFLAGLVTFLCLYYHAEYFGFGLYWFLMIFNVTFCWTLTGFAVSLCLGLWYDMMVDTTTRERLTNTYISKKNPFQKRWYQNFHFYFIGKKHEPTIFREEVMSLVASADNKGPSSLV